MNLRRERLKKEELFCIGFQMFALLHGCSRPLKTNTKNKSNAYDTHESFLLSFSQ